MDYSKIIGANIRYERKRRGCTPSIRGTSMTNLVAIADFFGITMDQLIRQDIATGSTLNSTKMTKSEKDRKALNSMISVMSDEKIQILTANAKILNKYDIGEIIKPIKFDEE